MVACNLSNIGLQMRGFIYDKNCRIVLFIFSIIKIMKVCCVVLNETLFSNYTIILIYYSTLCTFFASFFSVKAFELFFLFKSAMERMGMYCKVTSSCISYRVVTGTCACEPCMHILMSRFDNFNILPLVFV